VSPTEHHNFTGPESAPEREALKGPALSLAIALVATFLFSFLAENVVAQHTARFDSFVRTAVHAYASPLLTHVMFAVSFMGSAGLVLSAAVAFALFRYWRWRGAAIWLIVTLAGALVLELALKYAFHRPRPVPFFGPVPSTYSFPSGHSLFSFCFYGVLAGLLADRARSTWLQAVIWTVSAALVAAIGTSRIYLGVHYPSDVLGGYLVGAIWTATMVGVDRVRQKRKRRQSAVKQ
jgi:membrane-associated phospholipid phosphatase